MRSDGEIDSWELRSLVAIRPGEPLTTQAVRDTLSRLRLAGLASEVEVGTRPAPGGVDAVVVLRADIQVESVELTGELPIERSRLEVTLEQKTGRPLREDRVVRGVYALESTLADEGYLGARARLDVVVDPDRKRARVTYEVEPGPRWTVGDVHLDATEPVDVADLLDALRDGPGEPYRGRFLREEPDRLERRLARSGYRQATVEALPETRREAEHRVDLTYRIERGPRVEVEIVGADRKELEKKDLLPFLGTERYDEALLLQSAASIRKYYQEKGYWKVQVETSEERDGEVQRVRVAIEPGPKLVLEEIEFEGNELLPDEQLARRMATSPKRALTPGSGRVVDEQLAADLSNLRSYCAVQGFGEAKVGPARVEEIGGDRLRLVVPIEEGRAAAWARSSSRATRRSRPRSSRPCSACSPGGRTTASWSTRRSSSSVSSTSGAAIARR